MMMTAMMAVRRRREIEFLARELYSQAQGLMTAIGDLVPAELASGGGELVDGAPLRAVAEQLDDCAFVLRPAAGGARPAGGRGAAVRAVARRGWRCAGPELNGGAGSPGRHPAMEDGGTSRGTRGSLPHEGSTVGRPS